MARRYNSGPRYQIARCEGVRWRALPEFTGWPNRMLEKVTTAPLVVSVYGRDAVFVGSGRRVYAWWLDDGTPLDSGGCAPYYEYGLFFEAEALDPTRSSRKRTRCSRRLWLSQMSMVVP